MENTIEQLFKDYMNNPSLETQQSIASFYVKNSVNRPQIEEKIKNFLRQDLPKGGINWYNFFESNMKFWQEVYLINQEKEAIKHHTTVVKNHNDSDFFLKSAIWICDSACEGTREIKGLQAKIEKVWVDIFQDFPEFKTMLENERNEKEQGLKKYLESLNLPEKEPLVTIQILEIAVPIIAESNGKSITNFEEIKQTQEYNEFLENRVDYFNNFNLEGYIEMPACHSIKMRVEDNNNIFTLELNEEINRDKLKEELLGQLSDGLGESLSQKGVLIGDKKYYFDFDIKNASEFKEIELQKNKKMRIK